MRLKCICREQQTNFCFLFPLFRYRFHRDSIGKRLPPATIHRATSETSIHTGPTDRTSGEDTAQGSHRQMQEAQAGEGARGLQVLGLRE